MPDDEKAQDDPSLVKESIANYAAASTRLRDVAKWIATSGVALAALLIGTAPLSGIGTLTTWDKAWLPCVFAAVALAALGILLYSTSQVLAPEITDLAELEFAEDFNGFRAGVAKNPDILLGSWSKSLPGFIGIRKGDITKQEKLIAKMADVDTPETDLDHLNKALESTQRRISRIGWVVQRIVAAAEFEITWKRFKSARMTALICIGVTAICIAGFLATVSAAKISDTLAEPFPVRIGLTAAGQAKFTGVLGPKCPLGSFEALLTKGGRTAPWEIMITDDNCRSGQITVTAEDGTILFVPAGT